MRYIEGEQTVFVDSEVLAKPRAIGVWTHGCRVLDEHGARLPREECIRIIENIRRTLEFFGAELQVIDPGWHES